MLLGLTALRRADEEFANPVTTPLTSPRCSIGRGRDCDVVLEDPTRRISRQHCVILRQEAGYSLQVISQINPVLVNGEVIVSGRQHPLRPGDRLTIGDYEFGIVSLPEPVGSAADPLALLGPPPPSTPASDRSPLGIEELFGTPRAAAGPSVAASPLPNTRSKELDELLGRPKSATRDPLLDALGGGAIPGAAPGRELSGFAARSDPLDLLGRKDAPLPLAPGEEFLRSTVSPIDKLLKDTGPSADPLGLSRDRHGAQPGKGFGGGVGGSDELDHVHDVHLPFVPPGSHTSIPGQPSAQPDARSAPPVPPGASSLPDALFGPAPSAPSAFPDALFGPGSSAPSAFPDALFGPGAAAPAEPGPAPNPLFPQAPGPAPAGAAPLPDALFGPSAPMPPASPASAHPLFPDAPATAMPTGASAPPDPLPGARTWSPQPPVADVPPFLAETGTAPAHVAPAPSSYLNVSPGTPTNDPLGLFGGAPTSAPAGSAAPAAPQAQQPFPRPAADAGARRAPARVESAPAAGAAAGDAGKAIAAFLKGAGMPGIRIPDDQVEAFLEDCGATVRAAIEGLMTMLLARSKMKEELRASDRTMVAARENNPLKLSESPEEALQFVFDPKARTDAFLAPPRAVADACADLQAHELALVAGMRSALLGAVKLFEPSMIEKRFEKEGSKSLLANRKALLWDCFVAYFAKVEADADDNFDRVFGTAFLRAYHEQVRRLRG